MNAADVIGVMSIKRKRIWELDAFRGLCILGVIIVHTIYDLQMFGFIGFNTPLIFNLIKDYGGLLFVVLSGICATLGHSSLKRGIIVFLCGMVITGVTYGIFALRIADKSVLIHFGVLHLLGTCMILYTVYKYLPTWCIAALGIGFIILGYMITDMRSDTFWTAFIGIIPRNYEAADYFPVFPNLGWFMLGTVIGRTVYCKKESIIPKIPHQNAPVRFLSFCGRHSLWIYMGHQPIVFGTIYIIYSFL